MPSLSIDEAQARLREVVAQLRPGDEVVLTDNGQPLAKLVPAGTNGPTQAVQVDEEPAHELAVGIRLSMEAFWRDLPALLKEKRNHGRWVAYHRDERVGIGAYEALLRECLRRSIPDDEFEILSIRPRDIAPWEDEEVEPLGAHHRHDPSVDP